jgi:hypothetical protein
MKPGHEDPLYYLFGEVACAIDGINLLCNSLNEVSGCDAQATCLGAHYFLNLIKEKLADACDKAENLQIKDRRNNHLHEEVTPNPKSEQEEAEA